MVKANRAAAVVAEVCLYGHGHTGNGAGWLASVHGVRGLLGDGEPRKGAGFTEALWMAINAINATPGARPGLVHVYESSGRFMAVTSTSHPAYYGDLQWMPAPVLVLDVAE